MKRLQQFAMAAVLLTGLAFPGHSITEDGWKGIKVVDNEKYGLDIGGRLQLFAPIEYVHNDPVRDDFRAYMYLKQSRVLINGRYEEIKFNSEFAFGGEDAVTTNVALTLLDFNAEIPLMGSKETFVKVGQFKVPYGRQNLDYEGSFIFCNPSIDALTFNHGRDAGVSIVSSHGNLAGTFGVFTGGGINVPQRYLPEQIGVPLMALRFGYRDGMDEDLYHLNMNDLKPERTAKSLFMNVIYEKDTLIGHSSAMGTNDAPTLLIDKNWNPYLAKMSNGQANTLSPGNLVEVGWDAAARGPFGNGLAWTTEAQMDYGHYSNGYGSLDTSGARLQGSVIKLPFEVAMRGAVVLPDNNFANTSGGVTHRITGAKPYYEVTPAISYYFKGHNMKIIADTPILIDVPVVDENGVGSYVLTNQPDQTQYNVPGNAYSVNGSVRRLIVPEARLMFQVAF